jgi:hypothetical protein
MAALKNNGNTISSLNSKIRAGTILIFPAVFLILFTLVLSLAWGQNSGDLPRFKTSAQMFGPEGSVLIASSGAETFQYREPLYWFFRLFTRVDDDLNPEHREPVVAWGHDGSIYCVYAERESHYNPEFIMFTCSEDSGQTWLDAAIQINDTSPNAVIYPAIDIMADGSLVVTWSELNFAPYNYEIRYSISQDGGETWSPSVVVHPYDPASDYLCPSILVANDRILISFWKEISYPNAYPMLVYSDDMGVTWSSPQYTILAYGTPAPSPPGLAYNEVLNEVGLVIEASDETILFSRSTDYGETWSEALQVNDAYATSVSYPDIDCGNGFYYVVWNDNRNGQYNTDVWFSRSDDGISFISSIQVNDNTTGNQYEPHIRVGDNGKLHVCWIWNLPFQVDIDLYYSYSFDQGDSWKWPCPRVNDIPYVVQPYVAWTSDLLADAQGRAYIFWNDGHASDYYANIYFGRGCCP